MTFIERPLLIAHSGEYMGQAMHIHDDPDRSNIACALACLPDMPQLVTLDLSLPGIDGRCKATACH